jgi:hypothetical protein
VKRKRQRPPGRCPVCGTQYVKPADDNECGDCFVRDNGRIVKLVPLNRELVTPPKMATDDVITSLAPYGGPRR